MLLPRLFAHSLYESDRKLGACLELAEWSGGQAPFEETLFHQADALTATGSDDAVTALRNRVPLKCRFLGYGHRVSFGYVAHESLSRSGAGTTIGQGAEDVIAWDQQGCLSPHVIYVERGGGMAPEEWAQRLSVELALRESTEPSGKRSEEDAARTVARRHFHEVRIAAGADGRLWTSPNSTAWTVIYEADSQFIVSSLNRFIYVKAVNDLAEAMRAADGMRRHISTVGVAAPEDRRRHLAQQLAEWGVSRVCELGRMQMPPLTWRHDGRPALGDLVTWCDLEN